jgi:hypothetical protein
MRVAHFASIAEDFLARVRADPWANASTVDRRQRPYSRVLHPVWEERRDTRGEPHAIGWVLTHRQSHKAVHLAVNPHLSLAYIRGDVMHPTYVDCLARFEDDPAEKRRVWDLVARTPEPVGYDPAPSFGDPGHAAFGLLALTPWRIVLASFPAPSMDAGQRIWLADRSDR